MNRKLRPLVTLGLIAMAVMISACGSGARTGTVGANSAAADRAQGVKFAQCMRNNGVSAFPDPGPSGKSTIDGIVNGSSLNPSAPAFRQAISACKGLEPAGFMGHKRSAEQQQDALKFAQCMRANGVPDFPDPTPNGPLIDTTRIPSAAGRGARSIPGFEATAHKCTAIYSAGLGLRRQ
jgi:hypothetical protein